MKGRGQGGSKQKPHKGKADKKHGRKASQGSKPRPSASPVQGKREEESYLEPQHSIRLVKKHKSVKVKVALHRVPPKHIVFEPTSTQLVLHTLGHTKKYYLKKEYPMGVEVDAGDDVEATLEYGVLTCHLPIVRDPMGALKAFKTHAGTKRSRGEDSDEEEDRSPIKPKKRRLEAEEEEDEAESDAESSIEDEFAAVYPGDSDDESSTDSLDVYAESIEDSHEQGATEQSGKKKEKREKKKKTFLTTSHALDLIEEINVKEDSVRDKKLSMDEAKRKRNEKQEDVRDQRHAEKAKKKEMEREKVLAEMRKAEKEKKLKKKKLKAAAAAAAGSDANTIAPLKPSDAPTGILKKVDSPKKPKRRVSFSPTVRVKEIPIVRREDDSDEESGGFGLTMEMLLQFMNQQNMGKRQRKQVKNVSVDDDDDGDEDFVFDPMDNAEEEYWSQQIEAQKKTMSKSKKKKKNKQKHNKKKPQRGLPFQ